jgi:hypothetical protein
VARVLLDIRYAATNVDVPRQNDMREEIERERDGEE